MNSPAGVGATPGGTDVAGGSAVPTIGRGVEYRCGDCGTKTVIKGGDPVRCRQCGFRILYKTRTKRCKFFIIIPIEKNRLES
jgi:DNA-directed RNA polymerases I, II, and III subunit RPABC4